MAMACGAGAAAVAGRGDGSGALLGRRALLRVGHGCGLQVGPIGIPGSGSGHLEHSGFGF